MRFKQLKIDEEVEALFNPRGLVIAAQLMKLPSGNVPSQESLPAGILFNGLKVTATLEGYRFQNEDDVTVAFMENSSEQGSKYRFYNHAVKSKATMVYLLVVGDPAFDLCDVSIEVEVRKVSNGIYAIQNESEINGKFWRHFSGNLTAASIGWQYAVSGVNNGEYGGLKYLPSGGFNQAGSQRPYVSITANADLPKATDMYGSSQVGTHYDHLVLPSDIADANIETFSMHLVWRPEGGSWKNTSTVFSIELADFMEEEYK